MNVIYNNPPSYSIGLFEVKRKKIGKWDISYSQNIWILKMLKNKIEEKKMKKRCVKRSNQWKKLFIHFYPWKKQPNQVSRIFFSKFLFSLFSFQFEFLSLETQKRTRLSYTSLFIVVVVVHSSASWILSMFFVWCLSVMSIWWFFLQKNERGNVTSRFTRLTTITTYTQSSSTSVNQTKLNQTPVTGQQPRNIWLKTVHFHFFFGSAISTVTDWLTKPENPRRWQWKIRTIQWDEMTFFYKIRPTIHPFIQIRFDPTITGWWWIILLFFVRCWRIH